MQDEQAPLAQSYRNWFLDYASYVILDRAVPHIDDGLKPVQRRVLHTLWDMDDGRFHKVANVVGATMKLHPHGDASIGAALVSHRAARLAHRAAGELRQHCSPATMRRRRVTSRRGSRRSRRTCSSTRRRRRGSSATTGATRSRSRCRRSFPSCCSKARTASRSGSRRRSCRTISTTSAARRSIICRGKTSASSRTSRPAAPRIFPSTTTASAAAR